MFRQVQVRGWLQRFLGPVIGAREVALGIMKLLDQGKGGEVRLPAYAALIPWLFVLPCGVARFLRGFSGVDAVVDGGEGEAIANGSTGKGSRVEVVQDDKEGSDVEISSSDDEEE